MIENPTDTTFPILRIVPSETLIPHEVMDRQRALPLIKRLPKDGTLRHPPIVTELGIDDLTLMLLDGTNRAVAIEELGIPHILVQIIPYQLPHVQLYTWYHVVSDIGLDQFQEQIKQIDDILVEETDLLHAEAELARRAILAFYISYDGRVFTLGGGGLKLRSRNDLLCQVVDTYIEAGRLSRTNTRNIDELRTLYPEFTATVIFPHYETVEVLELARSSLKVPAGITRHLINGRALNLNYPLDALKSDKSLAQKNEELQKWLQDKLSKKDIRYYAESTYMFDE